MDWRETVAGEEMERARDGPRSKKRETDGEKDIGFRVRSMEREIDTEVE